jgi:Glycosyltransferase
LEILKIPSGYKFVNGYHLHRLDYIRTPFGIYLKNLRKVINQINPDIVQAGELISLSTFQLAVLSLFYKINYTVEVHIHKSVFTPSKKFSQIFDKVSLKNIIKYSIYKFKSFSYKLLIGPIISYAIKRCYPISNDAAEIAHKYLGIKKEKIEVRSLGTDCSTFYPDKKNIEINRKKLGFKKNDFICVYTGRISEDKKCHLLKEAIQIINKKGHTNVKGLFVGSGNQKILNQIIECDNCKVIPFVHYERLVDFYNLSDVGVWPAQESTSQLDILACAKPIIITDKSGTPDRAVNSGFLYKNNSCNDLAEKF